MRDRQYLLAGQNVTPRRRGTPLWLPVVACGTCLALGLGFGYRVGQRDQAGPSSKLPKSHALAIAATDQNWIIEAIWEPKVPGRFLGVEPVKDADVCRVHFAAEASYLDQLRAIQEGTAKCFAEAFTREGSDAN